MYKLNNNKCYDSQYWTEWAANTHIKSSLDAAVAWRELENAGVLLLKKAKSNPNEYDKKPLKLENHQWARLCIAYCFAQTSHSNQWEKAKDAGGTEVPSFNTMFNQAGKTGENRFWLAYISYRLFRDCPTQQYDRNDLREYIQNAWHHGAMLLLQQYKQALNAYDNNIVKAKRILFSELAELANQPRALNQTQSSFSGSLKPQNAAPTNVEMGEKIVAALQSMGKGVKQQKFLGRGVKYDSYLIQFAEYNDWNKLHKEFCSAMGFKQADNIVRVEQYSGLPHAYEIKILRDENDWDKYGKDEFQAALKHYQSSKQNFALPVCLGLDEAGKAVFQDFADAPHAVIAGATGMGKSVVMRAMLRSLFELVSPDEVEIAIVYCKEYDDFAMFSHYPNLWRKQIISEPQAAYEALEYFVAEMDRRYQNKNESRKKIVVVIDELVDLLAVSKDAEEHLIRLAIKARAAGIHLLLATQRPDAETLSGQLRDNLNVRIALRVPKSSSSNIILGESGAEDLVGKGDHLVKWNGGKTQFLHGYNV